MRGRPSASPLTTGEAAATWRRASAWSGRGAHERDDALALGSRSDGALERAQARIEVLGPVAGAAHQLAHDVDGELRTVEGRARLSAADARLGRGLGDAPAQRLVEPQLRARLPRGVGTLAHVGQVGQGGELVEQRVLLGRRAGSDGAGSDGSGLARRPA